MYIFFFQICQKEQGDIIKNYDKLKPIIQTIRSCDKQQIRNHLDYSRITTEEPTNNDRNFHCLLQYHANNRNVLLKEYLETNGSKAMYISLLN